MKLFTNPLFRRSAIVWAACQCCLALLSLVIIHCVQAAENDLDIIRIHNLVTEESDPQIVLAALTVATTTSQSAPVTAEAKDLASDSRIFGSRGGYVHGSLGISEEYTNNLYNVNEDKQENFLTRISPEIWIALPRRARVPLHIAPHNTSPGGLQFSQPDNSFFNKYQLYLAGGLDFKNYSENSELNTTDAKLEGMFQYNVTTDLSLQLIDRFTRNQDMFDITNATEDNQRIYNSNLFTGGADWQLSEKISTTLAYNHFNLMYDDDINKGFDRTDNGFNFFAFYDYSVKTNFFFQYRYLFASYDEFNANDNSNNYLYGGINWQSTVKTSLMAKAGYQKVEYDNDELDDNPGTFSFEVQMNWRATVKTSLLFDATYSIEQSDSYGALNKKVFAARVGYEQQFTDRFRGSVNFIYESSDYDQFDDLPREDDRYFLKPELQYAFRRWLRGELSYSFDTRSSSNELLDYDTNIFMLGISGSF